MNKNGKGGKNYQWRLEMKEIKRDIYLNKLISRKDNGLIKIITGIRRCGKSYLLDPLFKNYLLDSGIKEDHIIKLELDKEENKKYHDPHELNQYIKSQIKDKNMYYILLDEIQMTTDFESVLNSFLYERNLDVYVTGSNSKFLSSDIITEFRGRGDEIKVFPLSFSEYVETFKGDKQDAWNEYVLYGGLPLILSKKTDEEKSQYLKELFTQTYIRDIVERNNVQRIDVLDSIINMLASSVGSLTNPKKIYDTFVSNGEKELSSNTVSSYIKYIEDSSIMASNIGGEYKPYEISRSTLGTNGGIALALKTEYKNKLAEYKQKKSILALEKKEQEKGSEKFKQLAEEERKLKEEEKQYKINAERYEEEHYKKPIAKYRTLTKSLKYYEILDDIELVIHVQASDETLCDIYNHIDDLKALGRSEDFVDVEDIQFVNLEQDEESYRSCYSAYLNYEDVMNERINTGWYENRDISGTKYYLGKKYDVSTGKRIFTEKVKVIYTSDFTIDETSENVWVDKEAETEDGQVYIVNFL